MQGNHRCGWCGSWTFDDGCEDPSKCTREEEAYWDSIIDAYKGGFGSS